MQMPFCHIGKLKSFYVRNVTNVFGEFTIRRQEISCVKALRFINTSWEHLNRSLSRKVEYLNGFNLNHLKSYLLIFNCLVKRVLK